MTRLKPTGRIFQSEGRDLGPSLAHNDPSFEDAMIIDYIRSMRKDRQTAMDRQRKTPK